MNWATERARAVLNSVGYRENPEAAIAAAFHTLAEECAEAVEDAPCTGRGRYFFAGVIRAGFPKEEV